MTTNNKVINAVLELSGGSSDITKITRYHVLYGYVKLLCMNESTRRIILDGDDESLKDVESVRDYFEDKQFDLQLMKQVMPHLLHRLSTTDTDQKIISKIVTYDQDVSSNQVVDELLKDTDEITSYLTKGHSMGELMQLWAKTMHEEPDDDSSSKEIEVQEAHTSDGDTLKEDVSKEHMSLSDMSEKYKTLRQQLLNVIKGQDEAVLAFVKGCFHGELLSENKNRKLPKATFLFLGPPGVGKTLLAQTAAENMDYPYKTFNMSEYSTSSSYETLVGVSSFYKDSEEGILVKFVRENPKCILVFDEIEKAHLNTIHQFLQILDLGELYNVHRKENTSFKDAIIIFTSNACKSIYENNQSHLSSIPKSVIVNALKYERDPHTGEPFFPESICSRIAAGSLIMFNHLNIRYLVEMIQEQFSRVSKEIKNLYGYDVIIDSQLPLLFLYHQGNEMDARIANRQSAQFIKDEFFELIRQMEDHTHILDEVKTIEIGVDLDDENLDPEILQMFKNSQKTEVAVVCDASIQGHFKDNESIHFHFVSSLQELDECLNNDLTMVMVDLMYGLNQRKRGISLDDYQSIGISAFNLLAEESDLPVYLLEVNEKLNEVDQQSFINKGAAGVISLLDQDADELNKCILNVANQMYMEQYWLRLSKQGYYLYFNTAQITENQTLKIQYHGLRKKRVVDAGNANSFVSDVDRPHVTFDDVIGAQDAKDELRYFIKYLSNPKKFIKEGGKPAKGVLLYGPPGTGKTMLARAMAGESNVAFIQTSGSEFLNKYVGQSEQNVRDLFSKAKKYAPTIIFIDEIDAIGKQRTGNDPTKESVLNTLLTEMDGFETNVSHPIFVLAATNYALESDDTSRMALDPALVRRFDNRIYVDLPNQDEREQFIRLMTQKKGFVDLPEGTINNVAIRTTGLSLAILSNVIDLALRHAVREGRMPNGDDLQNALEEYNYGQKKEWGEDYYRAVAIHESGHAYIAYLAGEKPSYMTIVSRGNFGGYMAHESNENKPNYTKEELLWRIRCALGGRAAEEVFFGKQASLNTGASSDLQSATQYAINIICNYGMMQDRLIALPFHTIVNTSLAASYLEEANQLLQNEMKATVDYILQGKDQVSKLADQLIQKNHLTGDEIIEVLSDS